MSQGLFELRKDAITGWWVATIVDRTFDRERFALTAAPVNDRDDCLNCRIPPGDGIRIADAQGVRVQRRRHRGGGARARRAGRPGRRSRTRAPPARGARSSRRPASTGRSTRSAAPSSRGCSPRVPRPDRRGARRADQTAAPPGRPELGRAGGRPDEPPVLRPLRPAADPAPDRGGAGRRGAVPHPRGRVPVLPARARGGPAPGPPAVRGRSRGRLRPVRVALAVRGVGRPAHATTRTSRGPATATSRATGEALRQVLGRLAASLDNPPYNLVLHTAPLKEQVDATYHWHWEIHPRLREIAGLELGTGLPGQPGLPGGRGRGAPHRDRRSDGPPEHPRR